METRRERLVGQQGRAQLGAAVIKGRGDSKWAARVVLEVGRRSSSLLPDDSGADEAALAAQGIEAAHGIGVSDRLTDRQTDYKQNSESLLPTVATARTAVRRRGSSGSPIESRPRENLQIRAKRI